MLLSPSGFLAQNFSSTCSGKPTEWTEPAVARVYRKKSFFLTSEFIRSIYFHPLIFDGNSSILLLWLSPLVIKYYPLPESQLGVY